MLLPYMGMKTLAKWCVAFAVAAVLDVLARDHATATEKFGRGIAG
jgi:hypothetical protein